jgi:hypothetical protein
MAVLPCRAEEDVEAGSAALRVDWPVYPRRAEHNTVAEGGNRRSAVASSSGSVCRSGAMFSDAVRLISKALHSDHAPTAKDREDGLKAFNSWKADNRAARRNR